MAETPSTDTRQPGTAPTATTPPASVLPSAEEYDLGDVNQISLIQEPPPEPRLPDATLTTPSAAAPTPPLSGTTAEEPPPLPTQAATGRGPDGRFTRQEHDRHTVQQAMDLGISEAEIKSLTPDALSERVYWENRTKWENMMANTNQAIMQGARERPVPEPEPEPEPTLEWGQDHEGKPVQEAEMLPGLVNILKAQQKELADLKRQLAGLQTESQQRAAREQFSRLDRAFSKHEQLLGNGPASEMDKKSPEFARRQAILGLVRAQEKVMTGTLEQRIDQAVKTLFGGSTPTPASGAGTPAAPSAHAEPAAQELEDMTRQWAGAGLRRPTNRDMATEPPGDKKAEATVAQFQRDHPELFNGSETNINGFLD